MWVIFDDQYWRQPNVQSLTASIATTGSASRVSPCKHSTCHYMNVFPFFRIRFTTHMVHVSDICTTPPYQSDEDTGSSAHGPSGSCITLSGFSSLAPFGHPKLVPTQCLDDAAFRDKVWRCPSTARVWVACTEAQSCSQCAVTDVFLYFKLKRNLVDQKLLRHLDDSFATSSCV